MLAIAILAAGKGTRMKSKLPKVLLPLSGKSLIERVLSCCNELKPDHQIIVVGHEASQVKESLNHCKEIEFVLQQPQNGTGHAVQQVTKLLPNFQGELLVLNGDVPLLTSNMVKKLIKRHRETNAGVSLLTTEMDDPKGYGRVFADNNGKVNAIIEQRDCSKEQAKNKLVNAGVYCFNWQELTTILPKIKSNNEQKELYLTDTIAMFTLAMHLKVDDSREVSGINDRFQLSECESFIQQRLREYWMKEGVTFIDPISCTLSEDCIFDNDVVIEPQTHLRGICKIGYGCKLGPSSFLENVELGSNVKIIYSVINDTKIGKNVDIGPFSHIRPQTIIGDKCRIGNFVEIKKSNIQEGSKVNHLSYIGDASLGRKVNIGAGTITANYDGTYKHKTIIGKETKTGANTVLVAPINIGSSVTIGAGSTLTKDVPNDSLAIARAKQFIKSNWLR